LLGAVENLVVGVGEILSRNVDKKLPDSCMQERGERKPRNFPLGKGGALSQ